MTTKKPNKYDYKDYFDALKKAAQVGILNYDSVVDIIKDTCFMYIDCFEQTSRDIKNICDYICGYDTDKQEKGNESVNKEIE